MNKFRLPRKRKKSFKKQLWLYPADEMGNSVMAFPGRSQEDYDAVRCGGARNLLSSSKQDRKILYEKLNKETFVENATLRMYVEEVFAPKFQSSSYDVLLEAKRYKSTQKAYFQFVNAYQMEEFSETNCCMAVDWARKLIKERRKGR